MTLKLAYNTTDAPMLVDDSGYTIGGRLWGPVDTADETASVELKSGRLLIVDEEGAAGSEHPDVATAVAALKDRRDRREAAQALDKSDLVAALPAEVVGALPVGGDDLPAKADLVEAVEDDPAADLSATTSDTVTTSTTTSSKKSRQSTTPPSGS